MTVVKLQGKLDIQIAESNFCQIVSIIKNERATNKNAETKSFMIQFTKIADAISAPNDSEWVERKKEMASEQDLPQPDAPKNWATGFRQCSLFGLRSKKNNTAAEPGQSSQENNTSKNTTTEYSQWRLNVAIEPAAQYLTATAQITLNSTDKTNWLADPVIWLCQSLSVESLEINGIKADLIPLEATQYPLPYQTMAQPYRVMLPTTANTTDPVSINLRYNGTLSWKMGPKGGIAEHEIELAMYASWYPVLNHVSKFSHHLMVSVPKGFQVISNGTLLAHFDATDVEAWEGYVYADQGGDGLEDINLLASNRFVTQTASLSESLPIHVNGSGLDLSKQERLVSWSIDCYSYFQELLGPLPQTSVPFEIVIMPRTGQSYARPHLLVLSGSSRMMSNDPVTSYAGLTHELAHFWWNIADVTSTNDWINEGLAEYFSLLAIAHQFGQGTATPFYEQAINQVKAHSFSKPMAQTLRKDDEGKYFYTLGMLVFKKLHLTLGDESFFAMLRELHALGSTRPVTTEDLFALTRQYGGQQATLILTQLALEIPDTTSFPF